MSTPPPNDPCPCGSGMKYKLCCMQEHEEGMSALMLGDVDRLVTRNVLYWLLENHPEVIDKTDLVLPRTMRGKPEYLGVIIPLMVWELTDENGRRMAEHYRDRTRSILEWGLRDCLDARLGSWFSVWEVLEVLPEERIRLRDLLTGEEHTVRENLSKHTLVAGQALMACIVKFYASYALASAHPRIFRPGTAEEVARTFRSHLGIRTEYVDPERLKGDAAWELLRRWQAMADECSQHSRPQITNLEGDPLLLTTDHYEFDPGNYEEVLATLGALEGTEVGETRPDEVSDVTRLTVYRSEPAGEHATGKTLVARLLVGRGTVVVETNSTRRADHVRQALEEAAVGLHHDNRKQVHPCDAIDVFPLGDPDDDLGDLDEYDEYDDLDERDFSPG